MPENNKYKLKEIKKTGIFGVPDAYFEKFEEKIFSKTTSIKQEEQEFGVPENYFEELEINILSKISENEEYSVPQSYFEDFENRLDETLISEKEKKRGKVISLRSRLKRISYIVNSAAAIIVIAVILNKNYNNNLELNSLIDNNTLLFSEQELYSLYNDDDIEINSITFNQNYSDDEAIEYLSDSNLEDIDLINE